MDTDRASRLVVAVAAVLLVGVVLGAIGVVPAPWTEDRATVTVVDADGEERATVDAEVADTVLERYTGLSDHESLDTGEGMLFVHWREANQTYVMRDMEFGIDILFVGGDGEITAIHGARAPEDGEDGSEIEYEGRAKWVLEVPRGYADERGIEVGDEVRIEYQ